jgi:hypothetical protein
VDGEPVPAQFEIQTALRQDEPRRAAAEQQARDSASEQTGRAGKAADILTGGGK